MPFKIKTKLKIKIMKLFLLLLLLTTSVKANVDKIIPKNTNEYIGNRNISITIQPWGGRLPGPRYKVIAFMDGSVFFDAVPNSPGSVNGVFAGVKFLQRKPESFLPVLEQIRKAKALNPEERLSCRSMLTDTGGYTLTISDGEISDVTYANAACGKNIDEVFNKVSELFFDAVDVEFEINRLREQIVRREKKAKNERNDNKKCG